MAGPRWPAGPRSQPRLRLYRPLLLPPYPLSSQPMEQLPLRRPGPASPASGTRLLRPAPPPACGLRTALGVGQPRSIRRADPASPVSEPRPLQEAPPHSATATRTPTPPPADPQKNSPGTCGPRLLAPGVRDSVYGFWPRLRGGLRALLTRTGGARTRLVAPPSRDSPASSSRASETR